MARPITSKSAIFPEFDRLEAEVEGTVVVMAAFWRIMGTPFLTVNGTCYRISRAFLLVLTSSGTRPPARQILRSASSAYVPGLNRDVIAAEPSEGVKLGRATASDE